MKKIYLLPVFIVMAILMGVFIYWSNKKITPKVENIVADVESNTGDIKDKVEDLVDGKQTTGRVYTEEDISTFTTGDIIVGNFSGTWIAFPWGINFSDYENYKNISMNKLTQRQILVKHPKDSYFELTSYHYDNKNNVVYAAVASGNQGILYTYDLLQHKQIKEVFLQNDKGENTIFMIGTGNENYLQLLHIGCRGCEGNMEPDSHIYNATSEKKVNLGYIGDVKIEASTKKVFYRKMSYKLVSCNADVMMYCENGKRKEWNPAGAVLEHDLP